MHVVFLMTRGVLGGVTIHVRDLARGLIARGERVTVLFGEDGPARGEFERYHIPYECVPNLRKRIHPTRDLSALAELLRVFRRLRPDLVSVHTAKAGWLGRIAARLCGLPVVFTPHGWSIEDRISARSGRVFRVAEQLAAPLASRIVNVCESELQMAQRNGISAREKMVVIHNGVVDVPSHLRASPELQPPHLIMVARFEAPKDAPLLLHALSLLRDMPWELEFVGDGPDMGTLQSLAGGLDLANRVRFSGCATDVGERLSRSQVFVLASRSEALPRSILEAMRAGLPVVASNVGGVAEAVEHGVTGFVVGRDHVRQFAEALRPLVADPQLRCQFGQAGRRRYETKFTFDGTFDRTVSMYGQILRVAPTAPRIAEAYQ